MRAAGCFVDYRNSHQGFLVQEIGGEFREEGRYIEPIYKKWKAYITGAAAPAPAPIEPEPEKEKPPPPQEMKKSGPPVGKKEIKENVKGDPRLPTITEYVDDQLYELGKNHAQTVRDRMALNKLEAQYKKDLLSLREKKPSLLNDFEQDALTGNYLYNRGGLKIEFSKTVTWDVKTSFTESESEDGPEAAEAKAA